MEMLNDERDSTDHMVLKDFPHVYIYLNEVLQLKYNFKKQNEWLMIRSKASNAVLTEISNTWHWDPAVKNQEKN